ncbi:MAG: hypothetical protein GPOALKHO_001957 [Sodalis sp.]|nr:MAG: hypothetical protein GPOALKHO_001957 [Sodalis sp.]
MILSVIIIADDAGLFCLGIKDFHGYWLIVPPRRAYCTFIANAVVIAFSYLMGYWWARLNIQQSNQET